MKKNLPLDEQIIKQKKKIREKKVFNKILIILLCLVSTYFIITSINYATTKPKFKDELEVKMYKPSHAEDWIVIYKNKEYSYDEYMKYQNAQGLFTSGTVFLVISTPIFIIGIIITSIKIKNNKDTLNNLLKKQSHQNKFDEKEDELKMQKIQNEIETTKLKYCQYCGSKITTDKCNNCGAIFQNND